MESFSPALTIDIRRLRVLRVLHGLGTIAATAEVLHLTPSAVSQQIAALGRAFGVTLLAPQGRRVRLTPQALLLLEHAAVIDAELERARAALAASAREVAGPLAIGAFATAISSLVAPALPCLCQKFPRLHLSVFEVEAPECFTRLDAGELDLAITLDYAGTPRREDPRYARRPLMRDPFLAVLPASHPLAGRSEVDLRDLAGSPWIVANVRGPCQEEGFSACLAAGFRPEIAHSVATWSAVVALVAAGRGVALVPRLALAEIDLAGLPPPGAVARPLGGVSPPARPILTLLRAGSERHPAVEAVLAGVEQAARGWTAKEAGLCHYGSAAGTQ